MCFQQDSVLSSEPDSWEASLTSLVPHGRKWVLPGACRWEKCIHLSTGKGGVPAQSQASPVGSQHNKVCSLGFCEIP
jgi:hypothetical protein